MFAVSRRRPCISYIKKLWQ